MEFKIEENSFDSKTLTPKAGNVILRSYNKEIGLSVLNYARQEGYSFLSLKTPQPLEIEGFNLMGVIQILQNTIDIICSKVRNVEDKFSVRQIAGNDWEQIKELLYIASPTRFSKDPHLFSYQVVTHKLKILQHVAKQFPEYSLGAFSRENELLGFLFLRISEDQKLIFQEILVKPNCRSGFASLQLVKKNIDLAMAHNNFHDVITKIYTDNISSIEFFKKLGFVVTQDKEYHYHSWL